MPLSKETLALLAAHEEKCKGNVSDIMSIVFEQSSGVPLRPEERRTIKRHMGESTGEAGISLGQPQLGFSVGLEISNQPRLVSEEDAERWVDVEQEGVSGRVGTDTRPHASVPPFTGLGKAASPREVHSRDLAQELAATTITLAGAVPTIVVPPAMPGPDEVPPRGGTGKSLALPLSNTFGAPPEPLSGRRREPTPHRQGGIETSRHQHEVSGAGDSSRVGTYSAPPSPSMIGEYLGDPSCVAELKDRMVEILQKYGYMLRELQERRGSGANDPFPHILALEQRMNILEGDYALLAEEVQRNSGGDTTLLEDHLQRIEDNNRVIHQEVSAARECERTLRGLKKRTRDHGFWRWYPL